MGAYLSVVFGQWWPWLAVAAGTLYAVKILTTYRAEGPHYHLSFEFQEPARSVENLLVWLGVRILEALVRFTRAILNVLLEASAEVGEWFISRRPAIQESVRSRFLV